MPRFSFKEEASQRSFRQTRNDQDDGVGDDQSLLSGGGASVASSSSSILVAFMNETFESLEDEVLPGTDSEWCSTPGSQVSH